MQLNRVAGVIIVTALGCGTLSGSALGIDLSSLSNADASAGLKKALDQGINLAVGKLGVTDGFLKNPQVKIDLPPKLSKAESMMRMLGVGDQLDQLVTSMNRAAEAAVPESKVLLKQALKQMSLADAKRILTGGEDAATRGASYRKATLPSKDSRDRCLTRVSQGLISPGREMI